MRFRGRINEMLIKHKDIKEPLDQFRVSALASVGVSARRQLVPPALYRSTIFLVSKAKKIPRGIQVGSSRADSDTARIVAIPKCHRL